MLAAPPRHRPHPLDVWDQARRAVVDGLALERLVWHRFALGPGAADGDLQVTVRTTSAARAPLRCGGSTTSLLASVRLEDPAGRLAAEATVCGRRGPRAPGVPSVDAAQHSAPVTPRARSAWASLAHRRDLAVASARGPGLLDRAFAAAADEAPDLAVLGWDRCTYPASAAAGPVLPRTRTEDLGGGLLAVCVRLDAVASDATVREVLGVRIVGVRP